MKRRKAARRASVVLTGPRASRRKAATRASPLSKDALDVPVPGSLLVLLSRLHRSESKQDVGGK